jgi:cellulose synthase/poly-beta-1,6-N-acetylglucosamine synthase-like glycosyltransferase
LQKQKSQSLPSLPRQWRQWQQGGAEAKNKKKARDIKKKVKKLLLIIRIINFFFYFLAFIIINSGCSLALVNFIFGYSLPFTFAWFKFTAFALRALWSHAQRVGTKARAER